MDSPSTQVDHTEQATFFERIASRLTYWMGTTAMFVFATFLVFLWCVAGPYFQYSDTWQLVVNTGTSIVTFLMVFLIQRSQNRDMLAIKIQMGELIASMEKANNRMIDLDSLSERQLAKLHRGYQRFSRMHVEGQSKEPEPLVPRPYHDLADAGSSPPQE